MCWSKLFKKEDRQCTCNVGRESSVGIATRYRLDGPGIESRWGEIFCVRLDRPWGRLRLLYKRYRVFPVGKAAGPWRWPPTPSSAEVKEGAELYLLAPPPGPLFMNIKIIDSASPGQVKSGCFFGVRNLQWFSFSRETVAAYQVHLRANRFSSHVTLGNACRPCCTCDCSNG